MPLNPQSPASSPLPWQVEETRRDGTLLHAQLVDAAGMVIMESAAPTPEVLANIRRVAAAVNSSRDLTVEQLEGETVRRMIKAVKAIGAGLQPTGQVALKTQAARAVKKLAGELPDIA